MSQYRVFLTIFVMLFISSACSIAEEMIASSTEKPGLTILMREYNQPYVFENKSGILLDIFSQSLPEYNIIPVFLPFERGAVLLESGEIDAISVVPVHADFNGKFISDPYIEFHNKLVVYDETGSKTYNFDDLSRLDLIAFINARSFLGEKFAEKVGNNSNYRELKDQETQVRTLLLGRTDAIVIEKNIFRHFYKKLIETSEIPENKHIRMINLFSPTPYCAVFRNDAIRKAFNDGLKKLKESGKFNEIVDKYCIPYIQEESEK